ncbi:hypothetical protein F5Y16DRAFT_411858 [Xylariaceae sp. FL0255]|nr:hypothetical protein F5Y16DRAFT_411858 [Xylariaceae sp. FL0255]
MLLKDDDDVIDNPSTHDDRADETNEVVSPSKPKGYRDRYIGSLVFNSAAFALPAFYSTLAKLWVADIDASMVVTTDVYTYLSTATEAINEGLPRAAWNIIGDKSSRGSGKRFQQAHTLIFVVFLAAASSFANGFVPVEIRSASLTYVRIEAFTVLAGAIETAVAAATRALDKPDVPFVISTIRFAVNIVLDLLIISRFHVGSFKPTVNMQAIIQPVCSLAGAFAGLAYFLVSNSLAAYRQRGRAEQDYNNSSDIQPLEDLRPAWRALTVLLRSGLITFAESAIRNALYLWLVTTIVALGTTYATAWGVFNTIRWGLVMAPVNAREAPELLAIVRPALLSFSIALVFEVPIAIFLSLFGARPFALYISGSKQVADVTAYMWRSIDWCYIFYVSSTQLATVLLATPT